MIENVKKWRIVIGIIISAFIALLVFFPKGEIRGGYLPGWESAMVIFLQTIISWFIIQIILQNKEIKRPFQKALLAIFLSIIFTILIQLFAVKVVDWQLLKFQRVTTFKQIVFITVLRGFLTSGFLFFIAYLLYISGEAERLKKEAEIIKKENLEARLLVLQQQINPHFLFNALNTLHSISPDREVKRYVVNFSNVFRYQFNSNLNALASLEDELDFANAYLHIMKERFEDGLSIKINIPERYFYRKIPAVTLQMLIENAIKHNIVSEEFPLKLNLYIENEMLVVSNNVQPKESLEPSTGIGLRNIDERYQLLSEKSIQINVDEAIFFCPTSIIVMMKILIIEDEIKAAKELKRIIEENIADAEIMEILNSVKDSVRWFQENPMPDLIFSDIQLADGLSFSIFQNVEILCPVIFCTAYDQYAIDAFDTNSIDYLLKPIEEDKLVKAVKKFKKFKEYYQDENTKIRLASNQITNTPKSTLLVYFQEKIIPVKTEDISFFYATGGVNRIYTKQGKMFHINITLDELETQLSASQFFKANRQFIINRESILSIHHYFGRKFLIKLNYETPEEITISKGKSSEFMKWMES